MSLEMIIGCMFSGKSSELMCRIRQYRLLEKKITIIKHSIDNRYSKKDIVSHSKIIEPATFAVNTLHPLLLTKEYTSAEVIFIDEAQFFDDLYDFIKHVVDKDQKHVVLAGLDGNFKREPFRQIVDLIPFADTVKKMNAFCLICKDGTVAPFSKKRLDGGDTIDVGGIDKYHPVCRNHYISNI